MFIRVRGIVLWILMLTISHLAIASGSEQWIRYASISPQGDRIAFTYKGDIYVVPSQGGTATALTMHSAHDFMPVWSNDGSQISFASNRHGNFDVFVMNAQGGEVKRLTYHSANEYPYTFSADDRSVIFGGQRMDAVNHRQYPTGSQPEVYSVPVEGGMVSQLWTLPGEDVSISADGKIMLYHDKKGGENEWRKHHQSSITRDIWRYDVDTDEHTMLTTHPAENRSPLFGNDGLVYFLSERSGSFNVHRFSLDNPKEVEQLTEFELHPVRFLSISDTGVLCYTHHGDLYIQPIGAKPQRVDVQLMDLPKENNERLISVSGNVSEMAVSPDAKEIAYVVRGEVFVSSVEGGLTKRITNTVEHEEYVSFTPDGKSIIYTSLRNSKWGIYRATRVRAEEPYFYASTLIEEEPLLVNENDNYQPLLSPDGKEMVFIENRRWLKVYNLETKEIRELLGPEHLYYISDGGQDLEWSPDGKWLLVSLSSSMGSMDVILVDVQGKAEPFNLTQSGYYDMSPRWANDGKQIIYFSDRHGLRSHATSGSRELDVFSFFLTQDAWDKFHMTKDEYDLWKELDKKEKDKKEDKDEKEGEKKKKDKKDKKDKGDEKVDEKPIAIDWDGIRDRKKRLTIHSSRLSDAVLSKDGETLYYLARFEKGLNMWSTNLRTKETKMIIPLGANSADLTWSKDMDKLFLLSNGSVSTVNLSGSSTKPVSIGGEMDLDIQAERLLMFDYVWTRTKAMFYKSDLHGAPWDKLYNEYRPKVNLVGNDFEMGELLSELLGELNVSHSGARTYSSMNNSDQTASLGIFVDYDYQGDGIRIAEIVKFGPLDKAGSKVKKGMVIRKIDGELITKDVDYAKYLNRKAGKFMLLEIEDVVGKSTFELTIKPISLGAENGLLYDRWVRQNEELVEQLSNGELGYVHIPGMSDDPYRNTFEKALGKYANAKGLIVDTRFNGGGDLVSDLNMFLTGEQFLEYATETRTLGTEPSARWTKPSVTLVNESNYSDGHCFACAYQELGIGLVIGMPVPGTCSFAGWEMLHNGTIMWGAVPVGVKNKKGEWMENLQTEPDVKVKNMPGRIDKGFDDQLERAVEELLKMVK